MALFFISKHSVLLPALSDINLFERKLSYILHTEFFSYLLENSIKVKLFDSVMEFLIYGLKIVVFTKKAQNN